MTTKGRETERKAVSVYEDAGFERVFHPPKAKYRNQDVFGLFDVVAYHPSVGFHFGQVKTNNSGGVTEFFEEAAFLSDEPRATVEFLVLHEGSGWRLARPSDDGYTWVLDSRDASGDELHEQLRTHLKPR